MRAPSDATRPRTALSPTKASPLDHTRVGAEIKALERLGFDELRLQWRNRWGRLAPARLTRSLLYRLMVYRIQAEAFGDLDREIKRMLERLADQAPADPSLANADPADAASRTGASASSSIGNIVPLVLKPGTLCGLRSSSVGLALKLSIDLTEGPSGHPVRHYPLTRI